MAWSTEWSKERATERTTPVTTPARPAGQGPRTNSPSGPEADPGSPPRVRRTPSSGAPAGVRTEPRTRICPLPARGGETVASGRGSPPAVPHPGSPFHPGAPDRRPHPAAARRTAPAAAPTRPGIAGRPAPRTAPPSVLPPTDPPGTPAIGTSRPIHRPRSPPWRRSRASRIAERARFRRDFTVSTGTPRRAAASRGGSSSRKRSTRTSRWMGSSARTSSTTPCRRASLSRISTSDGTASGSAARTSRASLRRPARRAWRRAFRSTVASHPRAGTPLPGGCRSAEAQVSWTASSGSSPGSTRLRASPRRKDRCSRSPSMSCMAPSPSGV